MPSTQLALWFLVVIFLALVGGMVPAFLQLRRTLRQAEEFLRMVELELGPALIDLKEIFRNLNRTSDQVATGMEKVSGTLEAIGEAGQTVRDANRLIQGIVFPKLVTGVALMTGIRVGLRTLVGRLLGRR